MTRSATRAARLALLLLLLTGLAPGDVASLESSTSLNPEWPHPPTREDALTVLQPSHARPLAPTVDPQAGARPPGTSAPLAPPPETAEFEYVILAVPPLSLRSFFQRNPNMRTLIDRVVGTLFLAMSARLAWSR